MSVKDTEEWRALKFEELKLRIEHYKFYLKLALETYVFFYLITSGVLGFYLREPANGHLEFFLWLPMLIGAILGGIFIHGAGLQKELATSIKEIRTDDLKLLDIKSIPDTHLLSLLLLIFGYTFFLIGVLLILVPLIRQSLHLSGAWLVFAHVGMIVLILGGFARLILADFFNLKADLQPTNLRTDQADRSPVEHTFAVKP